MRLERLLSADWRKPVHVYANDSEYNASNGSDSVGVRVSMDDNAAESQPMRSAKRYDVDETDGLWRQSSAWIEQIGSDRLPPRASGSKNNAVNRSRGRTESHDDDNTGWGATPGTLASTFFADSLGGNTGTGTRASDGKCTTNATNGSRWRVVSAADFVRAGDLDVIARLERPDVTEQVVAEMHAALSVSNNLLAAVFADEHADERGGRTEEAMLFATYVEGQRFVEEQAGASVITGGGVSTDQPFTLDRTDSAWSSVAKQVDATGYHEQLYFETYAEGDWLGDQHYPSILEQDKPREHERWWPGNTAKLSQQQRSGPREEQSTVGGSACQLGVATSDNSETKSRWVLPWAEAGQPMPRWRPVASWPGAASNESSLPSGPEGGTNTEIATGSRRSTRTASPEAAIGAALAQKHRLVRLRTERQQQLRQQQMQYAVDRDRMQVPGVDAGHEVMMTREQPCSLTEHRTPRARSARYTHVTTAGEAPDEPEGNNSTLAADFFAAYLGRSVCDQ